MRWNPDLYKKTLDFAAKAHGTQQVPGSGFPYVVHLTKVCGEILAAGTVDAGLDVDFALQCALLHDSIEDAGVTRAQIVEAFGEEVAVGVHALTKNEALPKPEQMPDSLQRIRAARREVGAVKLADRITNLESPPPKWSKEKRAAYQSEAREIVAALGGACEVLAQRLQKKIDEYSAYVQ